ncbi:MAG: excinuclease ABC subunit UvrA [Firmicutes bacterium]|jgi:excinuclease ABC subunit A|nr:excinuclease ABC subunit UvrA [Bacillota bacterium]
MGRDFITIRGARQHNLKNINVMIPRDKLVVITGISGSGKSSLAFDTIYAEGQRRYIESLSAYARQFLGQMDKPDIDYIEGLSPAIAIDQKGGSKNPRSTVGTVTEVFDYLRLLFARIGKPHCPICGLPITRQTVAQIVDQVMDLDEGTKIQILAPVIRGKKGVHKKILENIRKEGFVRVRVNGEVKRIDEDITLDRYKIHTIEIVVDRLVIRDGIEQRLADSIELAMLHSDGITVINVLDAKDLIFSEQFACVECGISYEEFVPRMFSFNSPYGACPECAGLGTKEEIDPELVLDNNKSIIQGALIPWRGSFEGTRSDYFANRVISVCDRFGIDSNMPVGRLSPEHRKILLYGAGKEKFGFKYHNFSGNLVSRKTRYEGLIPYLERKYNETRSSGVLREIEDFITARTCPSCGGARLRPESLAVKISGKSIMQVCALSCRDAYGFFKELDLTDRELLIARQVLKEIQERLRFLIDVGLDYLTLDRPTYTLAGGEAQRIQLATQIGSSLVGVLYILDEPSIGLHQRDNKRLINTLKSLRDLGNTVIVVEHDEETIRSADHIIDIGPGAGAEGGQVVAEGSIDNIIHCENSLTGIYLSGKRKIPIPLSRRLSNGKSLIIKGAKEHNLKHIDVEIPLGVFLCITGVSGSGKSTLINEILYKRLSHDLNRAAVKPGAHDDILGIEHLDRVINVDQSPIGRTPRSNPATYTGTFDVVRQTFALTPGARARGYRPGRFSFNVKGGRCEACRGDGIIKIEMHFLPDVYVPCEVCKGKRYNRETLEIKYKGKTIADVLDMRVDEALEFFRNIPRIKRRLETLYDVGLGYIKLGQPATTLSGGEAQRVKLATELSRRSNGRTLYILDEPTTGLHFADIHKLLAVLDRLVDEGDTVIVIEHNLDVIKSSDYIIDLGPEGGEKGGAVVALGTPEEIAKIETSYTGQFLRKVL